MVTDLTTYSSGHSGQMAVTPNVVFGRSGGFASSIELTTLDGNSGFRLDGAVARDRSAVAVSGAGDVNGDGFDDLIIGAN